MLGLLLLGSPYKAVMMQSVATAGQPPGTAGQLRRGWADLEELGSSGEARELRRGWADLEELGSSGEAEKFRGQAFLMSRKSCNQDILESIG